MTDVSPETMARELVKRLRDNLRSFVEEHPDPGTEALAALYCADEFLNQMAGYSAALAEVKALRDAAQFLIDVRDGRSTAEYLGDKTEAAIRMIRAALVQLRTANGEKK
jgi:hypothetical protein